MQLLEPAADARIAELVYLDVLDMQLDGSYAMNAEFATACRAAYATDPSQFDSIIPEMILARAMARGVAGLLDVDDLACAALEVGAAE